MTNASRAVVSTDLVDDEDYRFLVAMGSGACITGAPSDHPAVGFMDATTYEHTRSRAGEKGPYGNVVVSVDCAFLSSMFSLSLWGIH